MDPLTIALVTAATAASKMLQSTATELGGSTVEALYSALKDKFGSMDASARLEKARKEYEVKIQDRTSPIEIQRGKLLANLTELQTEVMLIVSNPALLLRLLPLLYDQTVELYEARNDEDLKFIDLMGPAQIMFCQ